MSTLIVAGQPNMLLNMIRSKYPNYHPLLAIADIAHECGDDRKLEFECHKTIAKYIEPELKSLEVRQPPDPSRGIKVSLFDVVDAEFHQLPGPKDD